MAKIKLQVIVLPSYLADADSNKLRDLNSRRFLHFVDPTLTIAQICESLSQQYQKIYTQAEALSIERIQDGSKCDLDQDFCIGDVFSSNDIIRVLIANELLPVVETSFTHIGPKTTTPISMRHHTMAAAQSTPLLTAAPVLTTDNLLMSSKKRTEEYFDTVDSNIPHKSARPHLGPNQTNNSDLEDNAVPTFDESNVSLPPPSERLAKLIPTKRQPLVNETIPLPVTKRVTSGMLKVPVHTQLETQQAKSKSQRDSSHRELISDSSSDSEDNNYEESYTASKQDSKSTKPNGVDKSVAKATKETTPMTANGEAKGSSGSKKPNAAGTAPVETLTQEEILELLDKNNGRMKHKPIDSMETEKPSHESSAQRLFKSLSIAMLPSQVYPIDDKRGHNRSLRSNAALREKELRLNGAKAHMSSPKGDGKSVLSHANKKKLILDELKNQKPSTPDRSSSRKAESDKSAASVKNPKAEASQKHNNGSDSQHRTPSSNNVASDRPLVEKILLKIKKMDEALLQARGRLPSDSSSNDTKHIIEIPGSLPNTPSHAGSQVSTKNSTSNNGTSNGQPLPQKSSGASIQKLKLENRTTEAKDDKKTNKKPNSGHESSPNSRSGAASNIESPRSSAPSNSTSKSGSSDDSASGSSSDSESSSSSNSESESSSDSDTNRKTKIPRLATDVKSTPKISGVRKALGSRVVGAEDLKAGQTDNDKSKDQNGGQSKDTQSASSSLRYKSSIRKPILRSLDDLAKQGVPDVRDSASGKAKTKDNEKRTLQSKSEAESDDEKLSSDSSDDDSSSDSSDDSSIDSSDSDDDGERGRFLKLNKFQKKKTSSSGLKGLMSDVRKRSNLKV